jgi:hypothetical protein
MRCGVLEETSILYSVVVTHNDEVVSSLIDLSKGEMAVSASFLVNEVTMDWPC